MGLSRWTDGLGTLHLSRIFRGSFADLSRNSAAKSGKCRFLIYIELWLQSSTHFTTRAATPDLPQLRPYLLCQFPVHSHWSIPNEQNKQFEISWTSLSRPFAKQITFAIFRDPAFLFRESDVVQLPCINNTLRFFSWLTWRRFGWFTYGWR